MASKVLNENGIKPAPDRPSSWRSFRRAHWGQIAGMDFFTTEVWAPHGWVTHHVLFVVDLENWRVQIAGITRSLDEAMFGIPETPGPNRSLRNAANPCIGTGWWSALFSDRKGKPIPPPPPAASIHPAALRS